MKKILLAPNPTGTGHNMRMLTIAKKLKALDSKLEITVLLGSRQDVFTTLFQEADIKVVDLNPTGNIDFSQSSHLEKNLNWDSMISKYFVPTFFNGDKILHYLQLIDEQEADLLISDYNINASFAAVMAGIKTVFVTERHNFTLVDVKIEDLISGGFTVNQEEIRSAQKDLNRLFKWLVKSTDLIITDKLFLDSFESDKYLQSNLEKVHFTGSMYLEEQSKEKTLDFDYLKIDKTLPYIVATVSSTTMLAENKNKNFEFYEETFKVLKKAVPELQMVLIGASEKPQKAGGLIKLPYIPNWKELIQNSALLISHPGWITVTEVAYLNIPTIFYLSSFMEYHELEAYKRLEEVGTPVFSGYDIPEFCALIKKVLSQQVDFIAAYQKLTPTHNGLTEAAELIMKLIVNGGE